MYHGSACRVISGCLASTPVQLLLLESSSSGIFMSQLSKQYTATKKAVNTKINTKRRIATWKPRKDLAVINSSSHPASENIFYTSDICVGLNL